MTELNCSTIGIDGSSLSTTSASSIKVSFKSLYQWPESDFEFLRFRGMNVDDEHDHERPILLRSSCYHEQLARRQRFLRSYPFSKNEETKTESSSIVQKIKKRFEMEKKKVRNG